jgi:hypothetical protein
MPKTAQTGAAQPTLVGASSGTQYTWSDVTSHAFDMPRKAVSVATRMPTAYTNPCGACHTGSGM